MVYKHLPFHEDQFPIDPRAADVPTPPVARATNPAPIHWIGDAPTSLHGNGAASFDRTTRDPLEVTCRLCRHLLAIAITEGVAP